MAPAVITESVITDGADTNYTPIIVITHRLNAMMVTPKDGHSEQGYDLYGF